jgi:hypothetical protein
MSAHGSDEGAAVSDADDGEATPGGIQVEMIVGNPSCCPIAQFSGECDALVNSVARSRPAEDCEVAEFTLPADADPPAEDMTPVFETGSRTRYRYSHEPDGPCLCRFVEQYNCPVSDIHAENGDLFVTFYAETVETVRTIVTEARDVFSTVRLRHLSHASEVAAELGIAPSTFSEHLSAAEGKLLSSVLAE